jgi:hypothetical protein
MIPTTQDDGVRKGRSRARVALIRWRGSWRIGLVCWTRIRSCLVMQGPHARSHSNVVVGPVCSADIPRPPCRNNLGLGAMVEACTAANSDFGLVCDWLCARHSVELTCSVVGALRTCDRRFWFLRPIADENLQMGSIALLIELCVWSQRCVATWPIALAHSSLCHWDLSVLVRSRDG